MIGKLTGKVDSVFEDHIILDVNTVGYCVYLTLKTLSSLKVHDHLEVYIDTHVREDHIHLYGFKTINEKKTYLILQTVGGVGSKMAMQILSNFSPEKLSYAIYNSDKELLCTISGVGPKMAERMIIELKDKLIVTGQISTSNNVNIDENQKSLFQDAVEALSKLGIQKNDADNRIAQILKSHPTINLSDLIGEALRRKN